MKFYFELHGVIEAESKDIALVKIWHQLDNSGIIHEVTTIKSTDLCTLKNEKGEVLNSPVI